MKYMNESMVLDTEKRVLKVIKEEREYALTLMEIKILTILMNREDPISLKELVQKYYQGNEFVYTKEHVLLNAISSMRRKCCYLRENLITIPKNGYVFKHKPVVAKTQQDPVLMKVNKNTLKLLYEKLNKVLESDNSIVLVSYVVEEGEFA